MKLKIRRFMEKRTKATSFISGAYAAVRLGRRHSGHHHLSELWPNDRHGLKVRGNSAALLRRLPEDLRQA